MSDIKTTEYEMFIQKDDKLQAVTTMERHKKMPPGIYQVIYNPMENKVIFQKMEVKCDQIVDLPGGEFEQVLGDIDLFLDQDTRKRFLEVGLLPKNNILLHGTPGAGKTMMVNRLSQKIIGQGGIVLFNPSPQALPETFRIFTSIQPDTLILIVMEELDQMIENNGEGPFLNFLDGEIQKENAIYVATTNHIDKIPERIRRPGRFSVVLEVGMPKPEAREFYLKSKLKDSKLISEIVGKTQGFSIDMLKEVVRLNYCLKKPLNEAIERVGGRGMKRSYSESEEGEGKPGKRNSFRKNRFDDDDDDDDTDELVSL